MPPHRLLRDERVRMIAAADAEAVVEWLDRSALVVPELKPLVDAPVPPHR
jgi:hypothetical protein